MYTITIDGATLYHPRGGDDETLFDAVLSLEDNRSGSFEFTVPVINSQYDNIHVLKSRIVIFKDDAVFWAGRPLTVETDWDRNKRVTCEGWMAVLRDAPVTRYALNASDVDEPLTEVYASMFNRFNQFMGDDTGKYVVLGDCDFPNVKTATGEERTSRYLSIWLSDGDAWKTSFFDLLFDGITHDEESDSSDLPVITEAPYNGHIIPRYTATGETTIDILQDGGVLSDQKIEFGKNLLDITQHLDPDASFSILYPIFNGEYYFDGSTSPIAQDSFTDGKLLESETAINLIGRVVHPQNIRSDNGRADEVNTQEKRNALAAPVLAEGLALALTVTISALDLSLLGVNVDSINLLDFYEIISAPHGFDEVYQCTAVRLDLLEPQNNEYQFGPPRQTLTGWVNKSIKEAEAANTSAGSVANLTASVENTATATRAKRLDATTETEATE